MVRSRPNGRCAETAGRITSVMGHAGQHSAALTNTSMSACAVSSSDGTR
jgi:hypothetical protein